MRRYQNITWSILALALFSATCFAAEDLMDKELAVRGLYSQFAIAARMQPFRDFRPTFSSSEYDLKIELSQFLTGEFQSVANEALGEFVTPPRDVVLMAATGQWSHNRDKVCPYLTIEGWRPVRSRFNGVESVNWKMTVGDLMKGREILGFATYHVSLSYQGRTHRYRAATLFEKQYGFIVPRPIDYVLEGSTLGGFFGEDLAKCFVRALEVVPPPHRDAAVKALDSMRSSGSCKVDRLTKLCCGPDGGRCGVGGPRL